MNICCGPCPRAAHAPDQRLQRSSVCRTVSQTRRIRTPLAAASDSRHPDLPPVSSDAAVQHAPSLATSSRRSLLHSTAILAAAAGLPAAAASPAHALKTVLLKDGSEVQVYEHGMSLSIVALRGSIPSQWIVEFRQCLGRYAGFGLGQRTQLQELYDELKDPGASKSAGAADVITLGDAWLAPAIHGGLIQPLSGAETYRWWRHLPPRWQQLMRRDPVTGATSSSGPVWGCPYRWGVNCILYKHDKVTRKGRPILDWPDLLQPQLKGQVAFPTSTREFIGCALKTLGVPGIGWNSTAADLQAAAVSREAARDAVRALRGQAKLFSDNDHVRALQAGDVLAIVGSSTDLLPLAERSYSMDLLVPTSGALLWADVWVVPAGAKGGHLQTGPSPILPSWLEFCTQPARAGSLNGLRSGITPALLPEALVAAGPSSTRSSGSSSTASSSSSGGGSRWGRLRKAAPSPAAADAGTASSTHTWHPLPPPQLSREELRLGNENCFMPREEVLERSEFLLPLDADTIEFYRWLMQ